MLSKRYITFKQTLDNFAKKWIFSWIQDGDWLIRDIVSKYSTTHKSKTHIAFLFFKYFVCVYMIWLVLFSLNSIVNSPNSIWIRAHTRTCTVSIKLPECKWWENIPEKEDLTFRENQHQTWGFYTDILYFILLLSYIPYMIYSIYIKIKLGDINIFYWMRKIIYSQLLVGLTSFTWFIWAYIWSLYNIIYVFYMPVIYETFWSLTIPWII